MVDMRRVRTVFTGVAGTPWYSNIYFRADETGVDAVQAAADVLAFWSAWAGRMQAGITGTVEGEQPIIESESGNITAYESAPTTTFVGSSQEERLPTANQGLLRLQTPGVVRSRKVQGRVFLPGATEDQSSNGTLLGTTRDAMVTAANTYLRGGVGESRAVVWSRPLLDPDTGAVVAQGSVHDVTAVSVSPDFAILRSRRD